MTLPIRLNPQLIINERLAVASGVTWLGLPRLARALEDDQMTDTSPATADW
jgi:hypothetical protein